MEDAVQRIVGAWQLVHAIEIHSDGSKAYPFGEDAVGYIHYSDTGVMAVQISRESRGEIEDLAHLKHNYLAYFGRYEIDTEKEVVRQFVEGQLVPASNCSIV